MEAFAFSPTFRKTDAGDAISNQEPQGREFSSCALLQVQGVPLAMCRSIASRRHQGLDQNSEGVGCGLGFYMILPFPNSKHGRFYGCCIGFFHWDFDKLWRFLQMGDTPQWGTAGLVAGVMLLLCLRSCIVGLGYQTYSRVCCLDRFSNP